MEEFVSLPRHSSYHSIPEAVEADILVASGGDEDSVEEKLGIEELDDESPEMMRFLIDIAFDKFETFTDNMDWEDWIRDFEERLEQLGIEEDIEKIALCTLYLGPLEEELLVHLPLGTSWDIAKQVLKREVTRKDDSPEMIQFLIDVAFNQFEAFSKGMDWRSGYGASRRE